MSEQTPLWLKRKSSLKTQSVYQRHRSRLGLSNSQTSAEIVFWKSHSNRKDFTAGRNRMYSGTLTHPNGTLPVGLVVFLFALNVFLSITASLGNILILIALHKVSSLHLPTKLLFRCLAVTDLSAGLVTQPFTAIIILSDITDINWSVFYNVVKVSAFSAFVFCGASLGASTAISLVWTDF